VRLGPGNRDEDGKTGGPGLSTHGAGITATTRVGDERLRRAERQCSSLAPATQRIGCAYLACLAYLVLRLTRQRDRLLRVSVDVLTSEGLRLVAAKGCALGVFQR